MKTSNIILISFLVFLFGGITLLFIGSKYYNGINDATNISQQEKTLAPFSVVVAEPGAIFDLRNAKENKIIQPYRKDSIANFPPYILRNDTLFISLGKKINDLPKNYRVATAVYCTNIKSIVIKKNSDINMKDFKVDTLNINVNKSKLDLRFDNISYISLQAKDSDVYIEGQKLEKLVVNLDKTKLSTPVKKRIDYLSGSLKNTSDCTFYLSNKIILDVDKTSTYDFFPYTN